MSRFEEKCRKEVVAKIKQIKKKWHHDIKRIDGEFVENVVLKYKETRDDTLLRKILDNYSIFRNVWAQTFAPLLDGDVEAGKLMHDEVVWASALKFEMGKAMKPDGFAFNAYLVSAMLNQMKNHRQAKRSHKNHPRVSCPLCKEEVYIIDDKHLSHRIDRARYKKMFRNYPLVSTDGKTLCPITGKQVAEITQASTNRATKNYTVDDFMTEYGHLVPKGPFTCPATGTTLEKVTNDYPSQLAPGYTPDSFLANYPSFAGAITCPFTGDKILEVTQEYLDRVLRQREGRPTSLNTVKRHNKNLTLKARQVKVLNPYTNEYVWEITPAMLAAAGKTWREHLEEHATIWLGKNYRDLVTCPFTGRPVKMIKKEHLAKMGRTVTEFYSAVCAYPLRKWQVRCAICGEWVDNIWGHLSKEKHHYAQPMALETFEADHGASATKAHVTTNSYVDDGEGGSTYIGDYFPSKTETVAVFEIQDSLEKVATDELDRKIVAAINGCHTFGDLVDAACEVKDLNLPFQYKSGLGTAVHESIAAKVGPDFELLKMPRVGSANVSVMVPSKETIGKRLERLIEASDL